jgi:ATPase subunit of ABC transporter with duplicated ATPase domains
MAPIDIDGVSKTYAPGNDRELTAIDRIALSIGEGEFVSIIGPSGCGKSTLLHMIGGPDQVFRQGLHHRLHPPQRLVAGLAGAGRRSGRRGRAGVFDFRHRNHERQSADQRHRRRGAGRAELFHRLRCARFLADQVGDPQSNIDSLAELKMIPKSFDVSKHIDNSLVEDASKGM